MKCLIIAVCVPARRGRQNAAFRIVHHDTEYMPPEGARMIGHDIPKPGAKEAVPVFDKDGLKIEDKGRTAVVSGDTKKVQNMVRFSKDADVVVQ
ncbi:MAG: hypothetical protein ACXWVI_09735 [Methyloceanibacter sp.]